MHYGYLAASAGLCCTAFAQQLRQAGKSVLVNDKRNSIDMDAVVLRSLELAKREFEKEVAMV